MTKHTKKSFSTKIFVLICMTLIACSAALVLGIYRLSPLLYERSSEKQIAEGIRKLHEQVKQSKESDVGKVLNDFCKNYGMKINIYDSEGNPADIPGFDEKYFIGDTLSEEGQLYYTNEEGQFLTIGDGITGFELQMPDGEIYVMVVSVSERSVASVLADGLRSPLIIVFLLMAVLCVLLSISYAKLKFSAQQLSDALRELDHRNAELKNELEYREKVETARKDFFRAASHELKTPLTILNGQLTGMLYNVGMYSDHEIYLKKALDTTKGMEQKIINMMDISMMEGGEVRAVLEEVDLAVLIRDELKIYADQMKEKKMELSADIPEHAYVCGDKRLLPKALGNILENAVKYSPESARIQIQIVQRRELWDVVIENSGVHIEEEKLQQIYQPFCRLEESRNTKTGGTGLGLYIVKQILELHHITYNMRNTEEGVCFEAKFPVYTKRA